MFDAIFINKSANAIQSEKTLIALGYLGNSGDTSTGIINYNDDKHLLYTNRSLVDKEYVDTLITVSGGTDISYFSELLDTSITNPINGQIIVYNNGNLTNTNTITGDITILGDLTVSGTTTILDVENVSITDNIILINSGETSNGVSLLNSGIEIDRGTEINYQFIFNETTSSFRIGEIGNLQTVATREDIPLSNGIAYFDNTTKQFKTKIESSLSVSYAQNSNNLDGYSSSEFPRKTEDATITNKWTHNINISGQHIYQFTQSNAGGYGIRINTLGGTDNSALLVANGISQILRVQQNGRVSINRASGTATETTRCCW